MVSTTVVHEEQDTIVQEGMAKQTVSCIFSKLQCSSSLHNLQNFNHNKFFLHSTSLHSHPLPCYKCTSTTNSVLILQVVHDQFHAHHLNLQSHPVPCPLCKPPMQPLFAHSVSLRSQPVPCTFSTFYPSFNHKKVVLRRWKFAQ